MRSQLIVILKNSFYEENQKNWIDEVSIEDFRNEYPRYPSIDVSTFFVVLQIILGKNIVFEQKIRIKNDNNDHTINSEMFMNPSPYTVSNVQTISFFFTKSLHFIFF